MSDQPTEPLYRDGVYRAGFKSGFEKAKSLFRLNPDGISLQTLEKVEAHGIEFGRKLEREATHAAIRALPRNWWQDPYAPFDVRPCVLAADLDAALVRLLGDPAQERRSKCRCPLAGHVAGCSFAPAGDPAQEQP